LKDTYIIQWHGPIVPKARPRVTRWGAHMPEKYADWQGKAIRSLREAATEIGIPQLDYQLRLYLILFGKHRRSGDMIDNIPGAIADALVKAEVISNDSSMIAPGAIYDLHWSQKHPPIGYIALAPWLPTGQSFGQHREISTAINSLAPDWAKKLMRMDLAA
jgi:Holliday junction resolvase RusA-like endonuclease